MSLADCIGLAIAICTAAAAVAAWVSASASLKATNQANKEAEESRKAAEESRKIAQQQTEALTTAAKANALASRIEFYNKQILEAKGYLSQFGNAAEKGYPEAFKNKEELELQQDHLVRWLDQQTAALGVGLGFKCPGDSKYNERIKDQA